MIPIRCCRCETMIDIRLDVDEDEGIHVCPSCGVSQVVESDWTGRDEETDDSFVEYWMVEVEPIVIAQTSTASQPTGA